MKRVFGAFCASLALYSVQASAEEVELASELDLLDRNQIVVPKEPEVALRDLMQVRKSSLITVGLTMLVPGLGHVYLGEFGTAGRLMGTFGSGVALRYIPNGSDVSYHSSFVTTQNTWLYSVYASYRDVREYNMNAGYFYQMPTDSFGDLTRAPFNLSVLRKPEVWGGVLGCLSTAVCVSYLVNLMESHFKCTLVGDVVAPLFAFPIGIGEEAFFRGYLQSQLSEYFGSFGGLILSSLAFGAVHIPNALMLQSEERWKYYTFSLPLITTAGAYFGWLTNKNHSLKESVAVHSWYDFSLFLLRSIAMPSAAIGKPEFAISFVF